MRDSPEKDAASQDQEKEDIRVVDENINLASEDERPGIGYQICSISPGN